jgi:YesN/AraC family two-component response regulator
MGITPNEFVTKVKINWGKELLVRTDTSISNIAAGLQYSEAWI